MVIRRSTRPSKAPAKQAEPLEFDADWSVELRSIPPSPLADASWPTTMSGTMEVDSSWLAEMLPTPASVRERTSRSSAPPGSTMEVDPDWLIDLRSVPPTARSSTPPEQESSPTPRRPSRRPQPPPIPASSRSPLTPTTKRGMAPPPLSSTTTKGPPPLPQVASRVPPSPAETPTKGPPPLARTSAAVLPSLARGATRAPRFLPQEATKSPAQGKLDARVEIDPTWVEDQIFSSPPPAAQETAPGSKELGEARRPTPRGAGK
jgi:hypothetical protein